MFSVSLVLLGSLGLTVNVLISLFTDQRGKPFQEAKRLIFRISLFNRSWVLHSGEASPTFGHANANFSVFIDRIRNRFLKK